MTGLLLALLLVAAAIVAFVLAIRVGMLIGTRMDRVMEARHAAESQPEAADDVTDKSEEVPGNE